MKTGIRLTQFGFIVLLLTVLCLTGCGGSVGGGSDLGSEYAITILIKDGENPQPGVTITYEGTSISPGTAGPTTSDGRVEIGRLKGTVKLSFDLEDYTFEPQPLKVDKAGTYNVKATPKKNPDVKVPRPIIIVAKNEVRNRAEDVAFGLTQVAGVTYYYTLDGSVPTNFSKKYVDFTALTAPDTDNEATIVIKVIGIKEGLIDSEIAEARVTYAAKSDKAQVEKPKIEVSNSRPDNREVGVTFNLEPVSGVSYYYTLGETLPTRASKKYEGTVTLTAPDTDERAEIGILVIGVRDGYDDSEIAVKTVNYASKETVQTKKPEIILDKTIVANREEGVVFRINEDADVSYYYTLDGSSPTKDAAKYSGPVTLEAPNVDSEEKLFIKVIAHEQGFLGSEIAEAVVTYQARTYTLSYSAQDGGKLSESSNAAQTVHHGHAGSKVEAVANLGYTFDGWSDGLKDNPRLDRDIRADLAVEALFKVVKYSITYELNEGNNANNNPTDYTVNSDLPLGAASRLGWSFDGWFSDPDLKMIVEKIEEGTTGNLVLYAKWLPFTSKLVDSNPVYQSIRGYNLAGGPKVIIPSTIGGVPVEDIYLNAFEGLAITSVVIPAGVKQVSYESFVNSQLTSIGIPPDLEIHNYAFWGTKLTAITIPDGVDVGEKAFGKTPLKTITIGSGVKLHKYALGEGDNFPDVYIASGPGTYEKVGTAWIKQP